jgi:ankyrin repeat protein
MARFTFTTLTIALLAFVAVRAASTDAETINIPLEIATEQKEIRDANGNTELIIAAAYGDKDRVSALIAAGAVVNARGYIGNTALIFAAQEGSTARKLAAGYGHRTIVAIFNALPAQTSANLVAGIF